MYCLSLKAESVSVDAYCDIAGGQQRGSGSEGGWEEDSKQGIYREPAHRDWNSQDYASSSYSPAKGLSGKQISSYGFVIFYIFYE